MPAPGSIPPLDPGRLVAFPQPAAPSDLGPLTHAVRAGDERAFDQFYELYCDRLYRYLLVVSHGQEELTREVLQVAWTRILQHLPPLNQENKLWSWLTTVVRNAYLDALRRQQRAPVLVPLLDDDHAHEPVASEDALLFQLLESCLEALGADDQALVRGFYFNGQSHQQLAEQTGSTAKAIESKLARVRQLLHTHLLRRLRHEHA